MSYGLYWLPPYLRSSGDYSHPVSHLCGSWKPKLSRRPWSLGSYLYITPYNSTPPIFPCLPNLSESLWNTHSSGGCPLSHPPGANVSHCHLHTIFLGSSCYLIRRLSFFFFTSIPPSCLMVLENLIHCLLLITILVIIYLGLNIPLFGGVLTTWNLETLFPY